MEELNCGSLFLATHRPQVREMLAKFREIYVAQLGNPVARIFHDQNAFRQAVFLHRDTIRVSHEGTDVLCRPYAQEERERIRVGCARTACLVMHCKECGEYTDS